jgi:replication factor C small subunit
MTIFVEKYRPKVREDIVGNKDTIDSIFALVDSGEMTSMIFEGPAGVGKTTTARVIARRVFGTNIEPNYADYNASDDRGIDFVQDTIKKFAKNSAFQGKFKLIFLDEADSLTPAAQEALRRIMEDNFKNARFIFGVNRLEKLIDPIQSRCQIFRFGPISVKDISDRLGLICSKETGKTLPNENFIKIGEMSHGDMRKAINHLQTLLAVKADFTVDMVEKVRPVNYASLIFDSLRAGRFLEARKKYFEALELGYRDRYLINAMHFVVVNDTVLSISAKESIVYTLAETDYRITVGVEPVLAMDNLFLKIIGVCKP